MNLSQNNQGRPIHIDYLRRLFSVTALVILAGCCGQQSGPSERAVVDLTNAVFSTSTSPRSIDAIPTVGDGELAIPPNTRIDFFLDLPNQSTLVIDTLSGSPLTVRIERAMGGPKLKRTLDSGDSPVRIDIPDGPNRIALVSLETAAGTTAPKTSIFRKPRVVSTTAPIPVETQSSRAGSSADGNGRTPNIIVYLIDALRADHLGIYGYDKPISPRIDEFASHATVFDDVVAQTSWTRSAVASIFTGLDPIRTGVIGRDDALSSSAMTLAERLKACGYHTAALVFNGNAGEKYHLDQGFDFFIRSHANNYYSDVLNAELFRLLDSGELKEPFFLYIHTIDPHAPYLPPEEWRSKFASNVADPGMGEMDRLKQLKKKRKKKVAQGEPLDPKITADVISLYDAEIAHNDMTFGEVIDKLESIGVFDGSVMIFLADHGEEFWDHGDWAHGESLYTEVLKIPLIVKRPLQETGMRSESLVQQIDLYPTALDYAGCLDRRDPAGRSLRSAINSQGQPVSEPVFSVLDLDNRSGVSITTKDWKLIVPLSKHLGRQPMLFDRMSDPHETTNVYEKYPIVAGYMLRLLHEEQNLPTTPLVAGKAVVDKELEKELQALGYLE